MAAQCFGLTTITRERSYNKTHEKGARMKEKNIGSSFDSWLQDEGIYEEVTTNAIKRVTIRQTSARPAPNQIEDQQKTAGRGSRSDRIMRSARRRKEKTE